MQLYLPALTGRVAPFSAHVFMLESSSRNAERAGAEAQGQAKPRQTRGRGYCSQPQRWELSVDGYSSPQSGWYAGEEAIHSQWKVIMSSCTERQSALRPVLVICNCVWVCSGWVQWHNRRTHMWRCKLWY